ncbi:MAG TPA: alcohol dehydrogenase catalytic domain-containing protein [Candidatus Acidoferrum sp.]|nr:alcohol dehydrogenase catalytic domain-containing protein [Candidatus Acidoferrum sp.]
MKAMVLRELGGAVRLEQVSIPKLGPTDALLRVRATGVGLTVLIMIANPDLGTAYPRIPGHEIAGEVVEVGSEVKNVQIGDRAVCHFYLTCGSCPACRSGRETLCRAFRGYVGMAIDGGYAEYAAVPARNLCPIPPGVSDIEAAVAADAIATPLHACREEARISPGDQVLLVGAGGGVGVHAVQMAKLCGGWVLGADLTDEKLEAVKTLGADDVVDVRREELSRQVLRITGGRGVDAAIDLVASAETLEACVRCLAPAGRLVIVGHRPPAVFGSDPTFRLDPTLVLRKMLEIHGSRYVSLAEIAQTLELLRQRRLRAVVTRTFPLEDAEAVHQLIRQNALVGRSALVLG